MTIARSPAVWVAQPGSQALFVGCPILEALYEGTRGPGKTDALLMSFARFVGLGFGSAWRGVLFRRKYKQLADVVAKSKRWFLQAYPGARFLHSLSDYKWVWPTGEELLFRAFDTPDDYWNFHGHEYPWIGWEELTAWPTLDGYDAMKACCRSSTPGLPRMIRSTTNPYGVGHNAVKVRFIDPAPRGVVMRDAEGQPRVTIHGHWSENKALLAADPDYPKKLAGDVNPHRRKAWLDGSWDIVSGGMFDDLWNRAVHIMAPFPIPPSWRIDRAFDWGSSKPFSVGWWAASDGNPVEVSGVRRTYPKGTLFRVREWYGSTGQPNVGLKMQARTIAAGILEREQKAGILGRVSDGPADPAIWSEEDAHSIAREFEQATFSEYGGRRVRWTRAPKGTAIRSRKQGWELMRGRLEASLASPMEGPGLFVFDGCRDWIRTVPVLPRDDDDPDDVDTEAEDHAADETRYRITAPQHDVDQTEIAGM